MNLFKRQQRLMEKNKGSLTVEACVSLPVFLGVFLLMLFFIKITCINIILDKAVNETAMEIATSAYPISFLNEYEDKVFTDNQEGQNIASLSGGIKNLAYNSISDASQDIFGELLSGSISERGINGILSNLGKSAVTSLKKGIKDIFFNLVADSYFKFKGEGEYQITKALMDKFINTSFIDKNNLKLRLVLFPQGDREYELNKTSTGFDSDLMPGKDFRQDDVVITLEYDYKFSLPLIGTKSIAFRHTAVERAWINGENGNYTVSEEGINIDDLKKKTQTVYVTKTGIRYHLASCFHVKNRGKTAIDLQDARDKGYTPCKDCKPDLKLTK